MTAVRMEIGDGSIWVPVGVDLDEADPPGSISSEEPTGRQVYLFGWMDGDGPYVWRSHGVDAADPAVRIISAARLEQLADLTSGPYERDVWALGGQVRARWTLTDRR